MPELLVAGAGPAGLATALHARRAGFEVTVLDPRVRSADPIDKACGEGLMPGAVRSLAALDVRPDGVPFTGITYVGGGRTVSAAFRSGAGLGVRRLALSAALRAAAERAGVRLVADTVDAPVPTGRGVRVGARRADYLVAADGLHSPVRRAVGLDLAVRSSPRFGLRRHFGCAPWTDRVEVHWAPGAEAYVTPVAADLVGVAILSGRGGSFDDRLAAFPALRARLDGVPAGAVRGAGPLRQRARRRVAGPVLLVGDAAGYVDALTGEGIAVSLDSARALVACLAAGRPEAYEHAWRRISRRPRALTSGLLWASRSPLRPLIVPAACRVPAAFTGVVNLLAG